MQERGPSHAQTQASHWGPGVPRPDQDAYYAPPVSGPYEPAPVVKARPRWKTPVLMGVALVVGIAIGAASNGSKSDSGSSSASGVTLTTPSAATAPGGAAPAKSAAAPAAAAKSVVLQISGSGQKSTKTFTVAADWSVKYSYDCSSFGTTGNFAVMEHGSVMDGLPIVNTLGSKGTDITYQHSDAGQHSLEVNSECDWTLTVTSGDAG